MKIFIKKVQKTKTFGHQKTEFNWKITRLKIEKKQELKNRYDANAF